MYSESTHKNKLGDVLLYKVVTSEEVLPIGTYLIDEDFKIKHLSYSSSLQVYSSSLDKNYNVRWADIAIKAKIERGFAVIPQKSTPELLKKFNL